MDTCFEEGVRDRSCDMKKKIVAVAMSGGMDSTLAAALLVEQGYDVVGATLHLHCEASESDERWARSCCAAESARRARRVARALGIPHFVVDARNAFRERVVEPFCDAYLAGETPNPCVECNAGIKFGVLLDHVRSWGADHLATGHYARCAWDEKRSRFLLKRGIDRAKDQSYFLWRLTEDQRKAVLFPVGRLSKEDVLREVRSRRLPVGQPVESQDVCFVPRGEYAEWLESRVAPGTGAGRFLDTQGRVLGSHRGIYRFTVGQRRGLGLAVGEPRYVVRIDREDCTVTVGKDADLWGRILIGRDVNNISGDEFDGLEVSAAIRYRHEPRLARLESHQEGVRVTFASPERAATPGQSVVFYRGDEVVGGAVIHQVLAPHAPGRLSGTPPGNPEPGRGPTKGLTEPRPGP